MVRYTAHELAAFKSFKADKACWLQRFCLCPLTDVICHRINWFTVTQANKLRQSVCVHHDTITAQNAFCYITNVVPVLINSNRQLSIAILYMNSSLRTKHSLTLTSDTTKALQILQILQQQTFATLKQFTA